MTPKEEMRAEAMAEILETLGVSATSEQVNQIVKDFSNHLDMEWEMDSHQYSFHKEPCQSYKRLEEELKSVRKERDVYHNSVCKRRNTKDVWIDGNDVRYNP